MCIFFNFDHLRNHTSKFRPYLMHKFCAPSLPLPPLIFSYLQALIHGFLWWWACSWLIFSFKWHLQSPFLLLHSTTIDLQETKDFIDEEAPRPTSSTWSHINIYDNFKWNKGVQDSIPLVEVSIGFLLQLMETTE